MSGNGSEWRKQLKSVADTMEVLTSGGYEYVKQPEGGYGEGLFPTAPKREVLWLGRPR